MSPEISKKTPCGNSRLRIIHIGNTITYENQVFPICGNLGILVQQLLACKKSGVGVCSAAKALLDCGFNGFVTGIGCKIRKRSGHVCLLVEDHNADLDLCSRFCRLLFQRSKHTQRLFFLLCARGLIQHEYHIRCQRFLCTRQRQRHIGGPGVRIQLRCGLGSGNVPLNGVGAAAGGFFRKGPDAVQRKVFGQLLLAGQNRTVFLFPAVEGECTVHAVLRAGHTGRNGCNGIAAAVDQRLLCRSIIAIRQVTGNIIFQRVHQRMRRLERNSVRIVFYRGVLVSRFRRPAVDRIKAALTIISRSIPLKPAIMIPADNLRLIGGQNTVAAHLFCIRERKGRAVEQQVIACGRCGVVIHCAVRCDVDVGYIGVNCAAVARCCIFVDCRAVQQANVRMADGCAHITDTCAALCLIFRNRSTVKFKRSCAVCYDCAALRCTVVLQQLRIAESQIGDCADIHTAADIRSSIAGDSGIGDKVLVLAATAFFFKVNRIINVDARANISRIIFNIRVGYR